MEKIKKLNSNYSIRLVKNGKGGSDNIEMSSNDFLAATTKAAVDASVESALSSPLTTDKTGKFALLANPITGELEQISGEDEIPTHSLDAIIHIDKSYEGVGLYPMDGNISFGFTGLIAGDKVYIKSNAFLSITRVFSYTLDASINSATSSDLYIFNSTPFYSVDADGYYCFVIPQGKTNIGITIISNNNTGLGLYRINTPFIKQIDNNFKKVQNYITEKPISSDVKKGYSYEGIGLMAGVDYVNSFALGLKQLKGGDVILLRSTKITELLGIVFYSDDKYIDGRYDGDIGAIYDIPVSHNGYYIFVIPTGRTNAGIKFTANDDGNLGTYSINIGFDYNYWRGGKLVTLGDSISFQNLWQPELATIIGLNYNKLETIYGTNGHKSMGVGSSRIVPLINDAYLGQSAGNSIYARADDVKFYSPDLIILFGGQNDGAAVLGSVSDLAYTGVEVSSNAPSFCSAYSGILLKLITQNPTAKIVCVTPLFAVGFDYDAKLPFVEAIKGIAKKYSCECIDLLSDLGVNSINYASHLQDGVHPNAALGKKIGALIAAKL